VLPPILEALYAQETFQLYVPLTKVLLNVVVVAFTVEALESLYTPLIYREQLKGPPTVSVTLNFVLSAGDIRVTTGLAVSMYIVIGVEFALLPALSVASTRTEYVPLVNALRLSDDEEALEKLPVAPPSAAPST
jgi:hypothetical protein